MDLPQLGQKVVCSSSVFCITIFPYFLGGITNSSSQNAIPIIGRMINGVIDADQPMFFILSDVIKRK